METKSTNARFLLDFYIVCVVAIPGSHDVWLVE